MSRDIGAHDALTHYVSPEDYSRLSIQHDGLAGSGRVYRYLSGLESGVWIPNFLDTKSLGDVAQISRAMYDFEGAREIYRNFLSWMFRTFRVDETGFRNDLIRRLRVADGARVLVTGCVGTATMSSQRLMPLEAMVKCMRRTLLPKW